MLPKVETDRGKLQQILMNLINNAFQAVNEGCRLNISATHDGANSVSIAICDNGCGIAQANLPHIFEPFYTTKERGKGTGLGLAITYGLVKKLHGNISVNSKENEGTTFIITLPIRVREDTDEDKSAVGG